MLEISYRCSRAAAIAPYPRGRQGFEWETEMSNHKSIFKRVAVLGWAIVLSFLAGAKANDQRHNPQRTQGKYMGHQWYIDENHLIWWDGKPYVRYGFTGNGEIDRFIKLGFDQFNVYPSEELWVFSKDTNDNEKAISEVDEFTDELVRKGATYYAGLNSLWPWKHNSKIRPEDMVQCTLKRVWDITEFAGKRKSLELSFTVDGPINFERRNAKIYLFDFGAGEYEDISKRLTDVNVSREQVIESPNERYTATKYTLALTKFRLPVSQDLRVTLILKLARPMVPNVYPSAFPALWKPGIIRYYRNGVERFKKAYAKDGLRGMKFGDEINTYRASSVRCEIYVDFGNDSIALESYRNWLKRKFGAIDELNEYLETEFRDFTQVTWRICIYPFLENDFVEGDEALAQETFGLFDSAEQLEKIDQLQEEFRVWFYGYWLAQYARMAKEITGNVPVFLASAGIGGDAESYLQIHKQAMLQGVDGLVRNHYAWVGKTASGKLATFAAGSDRRFPLETVTELLDSVQTECGKTKTYFANEFGRPRVGGDDFFDDFGLGHQFSFRSKQDLRDFLAVLIDNGYKGFNMFKMNPNVEAAQQEVRWLSELKPEIVKKTVQTTEYEKEIKISKEQAISLARKNARLRRLFERHPNARASAVFNKEYGVWLVEFVEDGTEVGFASVSADGRVLETEIK